jgi:hypothetical protein
VFGHLLSKLPAPGTADWGFDVSVGIVVMQQKEIVCISDMKATFADFSADHAAVKAIRVYRNWFVVYAGNDVEYAPVILSDMRSLLGKDDPPFKSAKQVRTALHDAYWVTIHRQIENRVLRKLKFSTDSFRDTGSKKCTATVYNNLCAKIDRVELSLQFLLYGFSENGHPHIFLVDGSNEPKCYDEIGVWAIGSGAHAALSSLAFHINRKELDKFDQQTERAVYFACEAKFMAESSGHVGKDAAVLTIHRAKDTPTEVRFLLEKEIAAIKDIWNAEGAPRIPPNVQGQLAPLVESAGTVAKGRDAAKESTMPSNSETPERAQ